MSIPKTAVEKIRFVMHQQSTHGSSLVLDFAQLWVRLLTMGRRAHWLFLSTNLTPVLVLDSNTMNIFDWARMDIFGTHWSVQIMSFVVLLGLDTAHILVLLHYQFWWLFNTSICKSVCPLKCVSTSSCLPKYFCFKPWRWLMHWTILCDIVIFYSALFSIWDLMCQVPISEQEEGIWMSSTKVLENDLRTAMTSFFLSIRLPFSTPFP